MIRSIIVEDDPKHYNSLKELIAGAAIPTQVLSVCTGVEMAYAGISKLKPDLIFLDIDLGTSESGFDLLRKFEKPDFAVIFTTQHINTTNAISAIRACALDFLPKPLSAAELNTALARFSGNREQGVEQIQTLKGNLVSAGGKVIAIWIRSTEGQTRIEVDNIVHCESDNTYTNFHLFSHIQKKEKYLSSDSIKDWERSFTNSSIFRVHNEYLANLKYIEKYTPKWGGAILSMKNGVQIPVSKSRKNEVKKRLSIYRKTQG